MITFISAFNRTMPHIKHKSYEECAIRLARSLRENGGALKNADLWFWIDDRHLPDIEVVNILGDLGCYFKYSSRNDMVMQSEAGSWSPKIYAVKESESYVNTSHACWIDCDYYVNGDLHELEELCEYAEVCAPPMNLITNFGANPQRDYNMWRDYYRYFDITNYIADGRRIKTHVDKQMGWFYFTSSIMTWETNIGFEQSYFDISKQLFNSGLQDCQKRYTQTSVPLTILKNGYTWNVIPRHLAYMYHLNGYKLENDEHYPKLIHYCCNRVIEISDRNWSVRWK